MKAATLVIVIFLTGLSALLAPASLSAEVISVTGSATATVIEYSGTVEVERDYHRESVPQTISVPPAVARAQLDRLDSEGDVTAGGQVVTILHRPNYTGTGAPNDAGLDMGSFSDDDVTSWFVQGMVSETRTVVLRAGEVGGDTRWGNRGRVRSRVLLSGVLLILSSRADVDLSQVEARFRFSVIQRSPGRDAVELVSGAVGLVGGPNGAVEVIRAPGALSGAFLPLLDAPEIIPELPVVKAVPFTGVNIPYEYEAVVGEAFELELSVEAHVQTIPGGTGAAAVFGAPMDGLASVLQRVKQSDLGKRVAAAVSKQVDTTGQAYVDVAGGNPGAMLSPFSVCGLRGIETLVAAAATSTWLGFRRRRRSRGDQPGGLRAA